MMERRLISFAEVLRKTPLSRTSIYRRIKAGTFPKPVPIGTYKIAFLEKEVDTWIDDQVIARNRGDGVMLRLVRAQKSVRTKLRHSSSERDESKMSLFTERGNQE